MVIRILKCGENGRRSVVKLLDFHKYRKNQRNRIFRSQRILNSTKHMGHVGGPIGGTYERLICSWKNLTLRVFISGSEFSLCYTSNVSTLDVSLSRLLRLISNRVRRDRSFVLSTLSKRLIFEAK